MLSENPCTCRPNASSGRLAGMPPAFEGVCRLAPLPPLDRIASGGRAPSAAGSAPVAAIPPCAVTGTAERGRWPIDLPDDHEAPRAHRAGPFFDPATDTMIGLPRSGGDVFLVGGLLVLATLAAVAIGAGFGWLAATLN